MHRAQLAGRKPALLRVLTPGSGGPAEKTLQSGPAFRASAATGTLHRLPAETMGRWEAVFQIWH